MSDAEAIKRESRLLRGHLAESLRDGTSHFDDESIQLLKFHGSYQQDDRDRRRERREAGEEKAYEFMVRCRIPGGALTAAQYLAIDDLAQRYGRGTIRLTTRQGVQLHGVLKRNLAVTIRTVNDALLSTLAACGDVNRNVMACPAPARDRLDASVQSYARALAEHLAPRSRAYHEIWLGGQRVAGPEEEPMYGRAYLPRKFKVGMAREHDNCVDVFTDDVGFVAETAGGGLSGFTVLVGGGMGSTHGKAETYPRLGTPLCFVEPDRAIAVAEAVLTVHRDFGDRENRKHARLKYVVQERGIDWMREEVCQRAGFALDPPHAVRFDRIDDHLGWHRQADGAWFVGVWIANGRIADTDAALTRSTLRAAIARWNLDVRITPQQNLLLTGIADERRAGIDVWLRDRGMRTDPGTLGIAREAMACPALPTCGLAVAEAERALPGLLNEIEAVTRELGIADRPLGLRMTGCPNGCARPRLGDIGIVGRSLGLYDVYLGGDRGGTRLNVLYAQGVERAAIAQTLRPALARWKAEALGDESLGDFAERACLGAFERGSVLESA